MLEVANAPDEIGVGQLYLELGDGHRRPRRFRIAHQEGNLPLAHWREPPGHSFAMPWLFQAYQRQPFARTWVEIDYGEGPNTIVSVQEWARARTGARHWPVTQQLHSAPGYLLRIEPKDDLVWPMVQYNDTHPAEGNNFRPFEWSPNYAWCSEHGRGADHGETPNGVILADVTAAHYGVNTFELEPGRTQLVASLGSSNLDLKGAILIWMVVCTHPDGRSGRYHLMEPLKIGRGEGFLPNTTTFPDAGDPRWRVSFARDRFPLAAMPKGPDSRVERLELGLRLPEIGGVARDLVVLPTGVIKIQELAVKQPRVRLAVRQAVL